MPKPRAAGQERQAVKIGRTCKVCEHPERERIELACASGQWDRKIAAEFGLRRDSVRRHWQNHVFPARKAELVGGPGMIARLAERAAEEDRSLLDYLGIIRSELMHLFMQARDDGRVFEASHIAKTLLGCLESIGHVNGQLRAAGISITNINGSVSSSVNTGPTLILNDPQIIKMQAAIIRSLAPFPEAREAVIAALRDLDSQSPRAGLNGSHAPPLAVSGPPVIGAVNA
jgi:hypothetical protein